MSVDARTWRVCAEPGCPTLCTSTRCEWHQPPPWTGSTRTSALNVSGWQQQRDAKRILRLHHAVCHVCGKPGAGEVDHVIPLSQGGLDVDANKRPIHRTSCHQAKTAAEAKAGRATHA